MRYQDAIEYTRQLAKACRIPGLLAQTWGTHSLTSEGVFSGERQDRLSDHLRDMRMDKVIQQQLPRLFDAAEPYFVDRGLVELIERSAPTLPEGTRLHPRLFPSQIGCLFYDRPIQMPPRRLSDKPDRPDLPTHEPAPLSGFAWQVDPAEGVLFAYFYAWSVDGSNPNWFQGTYVGNVPLAITPWRFSDTTLGSYIRAHNTQIRQNPGEDDSNNAQRYVISARASLATLLLMDQQLTVCSTMPVDRGTRRRIEREGWKYKPSVQVVTLRRLDYSHAQHEAVSREWSCRWLVREHWRTLDRGMPTERTVLVHTYVKGPPDKPIKTPAERVWAVVR